MLYVTIFHGLLAGILSAPSKSGWTAVSFVIFAMVATSVGAYAVYKYRLRVSQLLGY